MSLDGLRAWIGEVERKLGKRTRVFLALAVIAIGLGGAAIYLAIDARESSVSESDVQALQEQLERRIDEGATSPSAVPAEPIEPSEPEPKPGARAEPESKPKSGQDGQDGAAGSPPTEGAGGGSGTGTGGAPSGGVTGEVPGGPADSGKLQDLLEQTREQNAQAEKEQAEREQAEK